MAVNVSLARLRTAGGDLESHALTIKTWAIARSKQTYLRRGVASLSKRGWTNAKIAEQTLDASSQTATTLQDVRLARL